MRRRFASGDAAEHRACHEARAAGIIEVEEAAHELARGIEPRQRRVRDSEHARDVSILSPPKVNVIPQVTA